MRVVAALIVVIASFGALTHALPSATAQTPAGPALETPEATLAAALKCSGPLASVNRDPVLLVHGTAVTADENWAWGYVPALTGAGFAACTVELPDAAMGDIQVSSEYVVHAIRKMAQEGGRKVAVIGFSQGGLEPRWALRYWPELRQLVSDYISMATPHTGADTAAFLCGLGPCSAGIHQMVPGSRFLQTLNKGAQAWAPVDYTSLYSLTDDVVTPPAARSTITPAAGVNIANIAVQQVCPASTVKHVAGAADGVYWALVMDALLRPGPADASRVSNGVCGSYVPGVTGATAEQKTTEIANAAGGRIVAYPTVPAEPALKAYAAADAPGVAPGPPATGNGTSRGGLPIPPAWMAIVFVLAAIPPAAFARARAR